MPLQNRMAPDGEIVAVAARGLFTGNRGIIHDPETRTLLHRRWTSRAWIACVCDYKGRRRDVMATRSWTELFFLDEATALAAGHRPCFFCRRADAMRFQAAWAQGNGGEKPSADAMDRVLDSERREGRVKRLHPLPMPPSRMPDGVMITDGAAFYLMVQGKALRWSFEGYAPAALPQGALAMLTPPSTWRALAAGFVPVLHGSAWLSPGVR
jgi:hypothetical protein